MCWVCVLTQSSGAKRSSEVRDEREALSLNKHECFGEAEPPTHGMRPGLASHCVAESGFLTLTKLAYDTACQITHHTKTPFKQDPGTRRIISPGGPVAHQPHT